MGKTLKGGHTVEVVSLIQNEVKGCLGCNACRYGKPCVQKDAFNDLVPKIKEADCLVFASPLYFWTVSARIKAFIERFYCIAKEDPAPPLGRYEKYPAKDCALLMTAADNFFWTFEQAVSYYQFALVNYIGFRDRGMLLAAYPTRDLTGSGLVVLSVYGSEDGVLDLEKYEQYRSNLPAGASEVVIEGGCHAGFGRYGAQDGDGTPAISSDEQINRTTEEIARIILAAS